MAWPPGMRGAALALLLLLAGCSSGADTGRLGEKEPGQPEPPPPVPYEVTVAGDLPPGLAKLLQAVAQSNAEGSAPATSRLAIRQRALSAQASLEQALRAQGYFDGAVSFAIVDVADAPPANMVGEVERLATRPKLVLRFDVVPRERYHFGALAVALADNLDSYKPPEPKALGLVKGGPAVTQAVLDAEGKLLDDARKAGFALAKLGDREAVVDHAVREMDVTLHLDPGQHAVFGEVSFTGADGVSTDFLRSRVPIEPGKPYDTKRIEEGQNNLFDTDLFSTIVPRPADKLTPEKQLDVAFDLKQRAPRTIGAEINYETDLGPGARVFWEHRNIFGAGERFRIEASGSQDQQALTSTLTKPNFLRPDQSLLTNLSLNRDRLEAYDSDSLGASVGVEREVLRRLKVSLGTALRYARIQEPEESEQEFTLLSLPGKVDWDFSNDRFSPTRGGTLVTTLAPYVNLLDTDLRFLKGRVTTTRYVQILSAPRLVLAGRASVGAMGGASRDDIPADERFYAGGGGSIRGYGFDLAGPLDEDDKPVGGRSVVEGSVELRTRFRNNFGLAAFLDAGTVDSTTFPSFQERVLFGAGPSLRYFTPIGPIRFDLGFPLNPRHGVDSPYQIYLSIGQAF
jgi:translocation and assembly module TamA